MVSIDTVIQKGDQGENIKNGFNPQNSPGSQDEYFEEQTPVGEQEDQPEYYEPADGEVDDQRADVVDSGVDFDDGSDG